MFHYYDSMHNVITLIVATCIVRACASCVLYVRIFGAAQHKFSPKSYPTFHRFLLPIPNSTRSFSYLARTDTSFFMRRARLFPRCPPRKNYISRAALPPPLQVSQPFSVVSRIRCRDTLAASAPRSFAARKSDGGAHEFREGDDRG